MNELIDVFLSDHMGLSSLQRFQLYREIIPILEDEDWDTEDESVGIDPMFDEALQELHPEWYE